MLPQLVARLGHGLHHRKCRFDFSVSALRKISAAAIPNTCASSGTRRRVICITASRTRGVKFCSRPIRRYSLPENAALIFRTVRTDHSRLTAQSFLVVPPIVLPTQVPITVADGTGSLAGEGKGPIYDPRQHIRDQPRWHLADRSARLR